MTMVTDRLTVVLFTRRRFLAVLAILAHQLPAFGRADSSRRRPCCARSTARPSSRRSSGPAARTSVTRSVSGSSSSADASGSDHPHLVAGRRHGRRTRLHVPGDGQRRAAADRRPATSRARRRRSRRPIASARSCGSSATACHGFAPTASCRRSTATRVPWCTPRRCCGPPSVPGCGRRSAASGLVDPTLVRALERNGYDQSLDGAEPASLEEALAQAPPRRVARPDPVGAVAPDRGRRPGRARSPARQA